MDLFTICEEEAIDYFKQFNLDISTKEKRVGLDEATKKQIFDFLVQRYITYNFMF